jgi:hypothetical protein
MMCHGHALVDLIALAACTRTIAASRSGDAGAFDQSRHTLGALLLVSKHASGTLQSAPEFQEAVREVTRELAHQAALARFRIERWHGSSTPWLLSDGSPTSLEVTIELSDGQWLFNPITLHHVAGPHTMDTLCLGSSTDPSFWLPNGPRGKQWDGAYVKIKDAANCVEIQLEFMYNAGDLDEAEAYWWFYPQKNAVWALEVRPDPDLGTVVSLNRMDHVWAEDGWPADAEDVQVLAALPEWTSLMEPPGLLRPPARDMLARRLLQ